MADSPAPPELLQNDDNTLELNAGLEKMIESVENLSVQLTWMAYDMVALRTRPEVGASMKKLEEAFHKCKAAVSGGLEQQLEIDECPNATASTGTQ